MYETYQDHPKQAKSSIRVVLAVAFLACTIGAGIFLITRPVSKPLAKEDARAQTGIVYDSSAVEGGWDNLSPEEIAEKLNEKVAVTAIRQALGASTVIPSTGVQRPAPAAVRLPMTMLTIRIATARGFRTAKRSISAPRRARLAEILAMNTLTM